MKNILSLIALLFSFSISAVPLHIFSEAHSAAQGTQVVIPVRVNDFNALVSAQGTIEFNASVISFVSVEQFGLSGMSSGNFGTAQATNGKITFSWFDAGLTGQTLTDNSILFALKFNVTGTVGMISALSFTNSITPLEFVDTSFEAILFTTGAGSLTVTETSAITDVIIKMDTVSAQTGAEVVVPVRVRSFDNMLSIQGTIEFDASKLSFITIEQFGLPDLSASNFGITQTGNGKITFSWYDQSMVGQSKTDNSVIFALRFNITGASGQNIPLSFTSSITPLEFTDISLSVLSYEAISGLVQITGTPIIGQFRFMADSVAGSSGSQKIVSVRVKNFQNIISIQGTIDFDPSIVSYVSVEQFGLSGMSAANFGTTQTASGKLTFSWFDETLAGPNLADSSIIFAIKFLLSGSNGQHTDINFINIPTALEVVDSSFQTLVVSSLHGHVEIMNLQDIFTGTINPLSYCVGTPVSVPYTINGIFETGNIFTAQLSDATGSFSSPVNIGSLASITDGTIDALIPVNTQSGTGYRIRVTASDPYNIGTNNGQNISIYQYPVAVAGNDVTICAGETAQLLASGGISYEWSNGILTAENDVTTGESYIVTVTGEGGCTDSDTVEVFVNPLPTADAGADAEICRNETTTLTAIGGTSYEWSTNETIDVISVSPINTTTYYVIVTDGNNCFASDSVKVTVNFIEANAGNDITICESDSTTLTATGGVTYAWSNGSVADTAIVHPNIETTFYVTVIGSNTCTDIDTVVVSVNSAPLADAGTDITICEGQTAHLIASGGLDYEWSNGILTATNDIITAGIYYVIVADAIGCASTDTVEVFVNPLPTADAGADAEICRYETTTLTATGGTSYEWSTNETIDVISVSPINTTTYYVTVTDGNNCSAIDSVKVTVNFIEANAGNEITICESDSTTLTATGGVTYAWSNGSVADTAIVHPNIETTYYVTVTGSNTCTDIDTVVVSVNTAPIANAGTDITICEGQTAHLLASGGLDYEWSNGILTATNDVTQAGIYYVTVADAIGCASTDTVEVFVNPLPTADAGADAEICRYETTTLTATGGTSYAWSTNETIDVISVSPINTTTYYVTVTDGNNCSAIDSVKVTVNFIEANAGNEITICESDSTTLTATGGVTYAWSNGSVADTAIVHPNIETTFYVTVIGRNTCTDIDTGDG